MQAYRTRVMGVPNGAQNPGTVNEQTRCGDSSTLTFFLADLGLLHESCRSFDQLHS